MPDPTTKLHGQEYLANLLFPARPSSEEPEELDIPPEQRRLVTDTFDFTVSTIVAALDEKSIMIPEFQRHYVWSLEQAARLIESLIIQCPIPPMYLNEEADERLTVVDGNQRLLSIYNYIKGNYELRGLRTYPDLNGYFFGGLDPRFQRHIVSRPLRFITIKKETHPQIKFDVFERINSGSVKLSPQELRHGIYYGSLIKTVDSITDEQWWRKLASQGKDQRMRSAELVIRFWAFRYEQNKYEKPLEVFLNQFVKRNRSATQSQLEIWTTELRDVSDIVTRLFGDMAFRTVDSRGMVSKLINSALFDAEMVGVSTFGDRNVLREYPVDKFRKNLREFLMTQQEFIQAVSRATSDEKSVLTRIEGFKRFLAEM